MKEIKDKLIEQYFNYNSSIIHLIEIENSNELIDLKYIKLNGIYLVFLNRNMFFKIGDSGKLIFEGQYKEEDRYIIKDTIEKYLKYNVFSKYELNKKLEEKLQQKQISSKIIKI